jgi:hypothetical protein
LSSRETALEEMVHIKEESLQPQESVPSSNLLRFFP